MIKGSASLSRQELIDLIRTVAREMKVDSLSQKTFLKRSGLSSWAIYKHFDSWGEACRAAGLDLYRPNIAALSKERHPTDEECLAELKRVVELKGKSALSSKVYNRYGRISASTIRKRFGSWLKALAAAGLEPTAAKQRERPLTPEECAQELRRVAGALGRSYLTSDEFDEHARFSAFRVVRVFGSWHAALQFAGLQPSPHFIREVPLSTLAEDFLRVSIDLGRIPTIVQLTRRSKYVSHTFGSGKPGGYGGFKFRAIDLLLSGDARIPAAIKELFEIEHSRLRPQVSPDSDTPQTIPHKQGRTLNFRAFVYAPTCEHDVVQMFGAVAGDLGFEIVGNRSPFPDCEARRRQPGARESFVKCLIEYEFASSGYRRDKHPVKGCDLVVCWTHDWRDCPVEVLELQSAIRSLEGWR